jgi:hypothetical protein
MVGAAACIRAGRPDPIRSQRHTSQRQQLSIQQLEYGETKEGGLEGHLCRRIFGYLDE